MVMGATAYRATDAEIPADALADRFTFVTYDRRGRGESGDTQPYAVAREVEDIAAIIAAVGGEAYLYGLSSGAVLALEAAAAGLPVPKLVLYEPPFMLDHPLGREYVETLENFNARGDRAGAAAYFMQTVGMTPEQIEGMKQSPFWPVLEGVAPTIAYDGHVMTEALVDGKFTPRWKNAKMPTLVITGDQTFPFIPASVDAVAAELPNARKMVLAGQGHGPSIATITPILAEFFVK